MGYKFGDIILNEYASVDNPLRKGIFVKETTKGIELTDGKGNFWITSKGNDKLIKIKNKLYCVIIIDNKGKEYVTHVIDEGKEKIINSLNGQEKGMGDFEIKEFFEVNNVSGFNINIM